ncbi:TPA: hypothetical protein DDW35_07405, partial [Candidatus Sumerlaeota bacterium]|nr:hypothetical protein [Candidatus Sumerlaeota bacterium]
MRFLQTYFFLIVLISSAFFDASAEEATRTITDMAGRKVTISVPIKRVFCTNGISPILVYTLAPEKLIGWPLPLSPEAAKYIASPYDKLPVIGGWFGKGNSIGVEQIIQTHPDMILFVSMGTFGKTDQYSISMVDDLQMQTHIPVVIVQGYLSDTEQCYRLLGDWLGVPKRGAELADYIAKTLNEIQE